MVRAAHTGLEQWLRTLPATLWWLVAANLMIFFGVALFGWDLGMVMLLFWAENGVIGVFNVVKMAVVGRWMAIPLCLFFTLHYGGFMAGHLLFIVLLFVVDPLDAAGGTARLDWSASKTVALVAGLAAIVASHARSFYVNFLRGGEHERTDIGQLMGRPYARVVVLHVTIIAGGFAILALGQPLYAVLLLVVLKTVVDAAAHRREHRLLGAHHAPSDAAGTTAPPS